MFHAAILLWAAGLAHVVAGNVDFGLAGTILLGSVPGVWLGSHWSVRVEPAVLRTTLAVVLIGAGLALLIKAGLGIPIWVLVPVPARRGRPAGGDDGALPEGARRGRRMMVVMTPEATPAQIDAVVERLQAGGVHAKVMPGELTTAIGAIGDPEGVREMGLEGLPGVDRVIPISRPYKLASSELSHHEPTTFEVHGRQVGAPRPSASSPGRARSSRASRRSAWRAPSPPPAPRCCAAEPSSPGPPRSRSRDWASRGSRSCVRRARRPGCRSSAR